MSSRVLVLDPQAGQGCLACRLIPSWTQAAVSGLDASFALISGWPEKLGDETVVIRCTVGRVPEGVLNREKSGGVLAVICRAPDTAAQLLEALPSNLDDFVCCPCRERDFAARLRRLMARRPPELRLDHLIGTSPAFLEALDRIGPVGRSNAPVLLQGETGVGKELFARAIHYNSNRASGPFVPINCSALPDQLFENELFGHAKGAFTDARATEAGLLGEANGGTLFLDEVDLLTLSSQAKLLRFLQDHEYRPLGSSKTLVSDARILAASNARLRDLVEARQFREDLYYRLNVLAVPIPPLRERGCDIPLLAEYFAAQFAVQYKRGPIQFSPAAIAKMVSYGWPGNVRELEGTVHRAIVFNSSSVLDGSAIDVAGEPPQPNERGRAKEAAMLGFERVYLINLLSQNSGNLSRSATVAGTDRRTLQRLLRKHGINRRSLCEQ